MGYYWIMLRMSNKFDYRLKMVEWALKSGISSASREFETTRETVRKWVGRFKQNRLEGLQELSRAPKHIPHKMKEENECKLRDIRQRHSSWGSISNQGSVWSRGEL